MAENKKDDRYFAVYEGGEWNVRHGLDPDLTNYGPFPSRDEAREALRPESNIELDEYVPPAKEKATLVPTIRRLADSLEPGSEARNAGIGAQESDTTRAVKKQLAEYNFESQEAIAEFAAVVDRIAARANSSAEAASDLGSLLAQAAEKLEPQQSPEVTQEVERDYPDIYAAVQQTIDEKRYLRSLVGEERMHLARQTAELVIAQNGELPMPGENAQAMQGLSAALADAGTSLRRERERAGVGRTI